MEAAATALPFAAAAPVRSAARVAVGCAARPRPRRGRGRGASVVAKLEGGLGKGVPTTNYVVPLDKATGMTRPLVEILRDLNKRVPDKIIDPDTNTVPWYHANRMLSFYAPGWCGEVRDVIYSENGTVTVVYRVILKGTDGEAYRDATGTAQVHEGRREDPVAAAEEVAFCKACARFGFGLYLYHQDETHRDDDSFH
ncbi:DNA repair RAD52-like protein 2, chloroplastic [Phragmites australis]|uniref:DNA repair RAD52-like protein 2, chloroplastic n=1 Tax=Phragmites australis TaxID=29695 RepID=UPI002D784E7F|nr:DNA repair RAD52-like protein 2, chloroplastic [Phragmites australis]